MPPKDAVNENQDSEILDADSALRDTINCMQEAFALFDADDHLIFCNEAYTNIHPLGGSFIRPGVAFEDIIRTNVKNGNVADAFGREEEYILERLELHRNPKGPIYRRLASGKTFIINESRTPDGHTLFTSTEVTELRQIEADLREKEALTRRMLEASPVGVLITTRGGEHLFSNTLGYELQGVTREELFASDAASYYADPGERKRLKDDLYETGFTPPTEVEMVKPDGTPYFVILTSTLLEFEGQKAHLTYLYDITERKKNEEALRSSESRLRGAIDSLQEGFALYDADDRLVLFNEEFKRLHPGLDDVIKPGMYFEDLIRAHTERGMNARAIGREEEHIRERMEQHRNPPGPITRTLANGTSYIIKESRTPDGGTAVTETDITERLKLERQAQAERELLHDALESIEGGVALFDAEDRFVLCNSIYRKNLKEIEHVLAPGHTYEELLRAYAKKGLNTETRDDPEKYIRERLARHRNLEPSTIQMVKTGEWIMLREYRTSEGGTLITRTNVTERINAETALRESEARFRDIADATSDHFWEMGPDLRFTFVSERFLHESGVPPEDIIGKTRWEFVGKGAVKENPGLWEAHEKDMKAQKPFRNFEYSLKLSDGQIHYLSVSGKPFFGPDGTFMGYRGASSDITDYHRAQRDLSHHNKMESLGHLAGGIAHNLNNMLQPILILGQMTKDNLEKDSRDHKNLEIICRAGASAKELVERISTFSRQQGLIRKRVDIAEIVRDGLNIIGSTIPPSITLKDELDRGIGLVLADRVQIQTVLMNLVANAVDAMDGQTGELSISLSRTEVDGGATGSVTGLENGVYAKLSVADTGPGIDDETLTKIFDPFFTTKGVGMGTGLGLSSAFGIIQKHDGIIRALSKMGIGTTFEVYLPLEQSVKN